MALLLHFWLIMVYQPFSNCCPLCLSFGIIFLWRYNIFHEIYRCFFLSFFFCRYLWFLLLLALNSVCTHTQVKKKLDFIWTISYNILLISLVISFFSFFFFCLIFLPVSELHSSPGYEQHLCLVFTTKTLFFISRNLSRHVDVSVSRFMGEASCSALLCTRWFCRDRCEL